MTTDLPEGRKTSPAQVPMFIKEETVSEPVRWDRASGPVTEFVRPAVRAQAETVRNALLSEAVR